jgi:hypothetical protein
MTGLSIDELWDKAFIDPIPFLRTANNDSMLALFDKKGFFLSSSAKTAYDSIKNSPHIYVLRLMSDDEIYFGKSNQPGGRLKRSHAYHLGGLAHELLRTTRYDDQRAHSFWIPAWFEINTLGKQEPYFAIRMREPVVASFMVCSANELLPLESSLVQEAIRKGKRVLNRRL